MKLLVCFLLSCCSLLVSAQEKPSVTVHRNVFVLGAKFSITVVADNEEIGYINIEEAISEIKRVEKMISASDENSETSLINKSAGIKPVEVSREMYELLERSIKLSEMTYGAFDITQAPLEYLWRHENSVQYMPTDDEIKEAMKVVGYKNIVLNEKDQTVFLRLKGMKISFSNIGRGYAIDKAKELMVSIQVRAGVINADGDLSTWGTKATGEKWLIGIADPLSKEKMFSWIPVLESSVGTTQTYDRFISYKGKKHSQIIDPRTGTPAIGTHYVSVFNKSAEFSDALSYAVFVLGVDRGMALVYQMKATEVIIMDSNNVMHKSIGVLFD